MNYSYPTAMYEGVFNSMPQVTKMESKQKVTRKLPISAEKLLIWT